MKSINDYSEYLAAIKDKASKDPSVRNEANLALEFLQKEDPSRYNLYQTLNGEIEQPKTESPKEKRRVYDKDTYIKEHPEINVTELHKQARERLKKKPNNLGTLLEIPLWLSQEDLLSSVEQLSISDLITASGKPVPRQTLLRKCFKIAVSERRIDVTKLRNYICNLFCSYYNSKIITLRTASLYEPVKKMIMEEATVEELVKISNDSGLYIGELAALIHKKESEFSEEQLKMMQSKEAAIAEKKARRKARKKAKKEALKANKENTSNE